MVQWQVQLNKAKWYKDGYIIDPIRLISLSFTIYVTITNMCH